MTVRELVKVLRTFDQDLEVGADDDILDRPTVVTVEETETAIGPVVTIAIGGVE